MLKSGTPDRFRRSVYLGDVEQMFLGHYEHTIDEKGRLTIPFRFRDLLEEGAYITMGFDGNLIVMTGTYFADLANKINSHSLTDSSNRLLHRQFFSSADRVEVDRAGRILIPQFLRQSLKLESIAIVVGAGRYFEIWTPSGWAKQQELLQDAETTSQLFATLDISA
jgi:MraZ protein